MKQFRGLFLLLTLVVVLPAVIAFYFAETNAAAQTTETSGSLAVVDSSGKPASVCPLKHTDVKAEITGFLSRVVVTQHFENPFSSPIEAVYTFPLPQNAAVDDMTMTIGERTIRGKILPREEAQAVYEGAKSRGQVASLLDQERPNIFTQSIANILPGEQIKISISYVETLRYEDGAYEFVFPMVVGPRYVPGAPSSASNSGGSAPNTDSVPDGSRITPRPAAPGERSGHDISLDVTLDAGLIVESLESKTHRVDVDRPSSTRAHLKLKRGATIPNKDFILRYDVAGRSIQDALLTHRSDKGSFFTLILQPPDRVATDDVTPKELVFVLDTSGSMSGFPIEKAKETMRLALDNLYPSDTFNLITFSGDTRILFPEPVPATTGNLRRAQEFLAASSGGGGTEMMGAIKAALEPTDSQSHVRIVCFMTDGYVGNDMQIINEVQKYKNARVFAFGIGSSVNRFLLDNMALAGRGEVEYVGLKDDGSAAAKRFHQRVRNPLLTDLSIDWNGLPVADVYPQRIPDLFGAKPVIMTGRYTSPGSGTIRLKGNMAGSPYTREIQVTLPETMALHDVLAPLWARARIDSLMSEDYFGVQRNRIREDLKNAITQLGMEFRLMTQFTSFVAVEEMVVTDGGRLRRIEVPVEVPAGVDRLAAYDAGGGGPTGLFTTYNANGGYIVQGFIGQRNKRAAATSNAAPAVTVGAAVSPAAPTPSPNRTRGQVTVSGGVSSVSGDFGLLAEPAKSPEQQKLDRLRFKTHATIFALINRLKNKNEPRIHNWGNFVREGNAEVQVWLTEKSDAARLKLKELGFEVVLDSPNSTLIIGRLSMDKLELLPELDFVRYVSPQISR
ncbi:MAG TPA: VIT and VWA domain-containing protein [Pyrinomonadaceae bacterium]|nr:VIT and VWA domain-containing protein [Pyrinomonadaceae bacterium]